jgi:hypothetical protein
MAVQPAPAPWPTVVLATAAPVATSQMVTLAGHVFLLLERSGKDRCVTGAATRMSQTVGVVSGQAGAGVQFSVRVTRENQRGVFLFLDLGIGGVVRPGAAFSAVAPVPPATPPVDPIGARGSVNVGTLPLSGITWRGMAGLRF